MIRPDEVRRRLKQRLLPGMHVTGDLSSALAEHAHVEVDGG